MRPNARGSPPLLLPPSLPDAREARTHVPLEDGTGRLNLLFIHFDYFFRAVRDRHTRNPTRPRKPVCTTDGFACLSYLQRRLRQGGPLPATGSTRRRRSQRKEKKEKSNTLSATIIDDGSAIKGARYWFPAPWKGSIGRVKRGIHVSSTNFGNRACISPLLLIPNPPVA